MGLSGFVLIDDIRPELRHSTRRDMQNVYAVETRSSIRGLP